MQYFSLSKRFRAQLRTRSRSESPNLWFDERFFSIHRLRLFREIQHDFGDVARKKLSNPSKNGPISRPNSLIEKIALVKPVKLLTLSGCSFYQYSWCFDAIWLNCFFSQWQVQRSGKADGIKGGEGTFEIYFTKRGPLFATTNGI